MTLNDSSAQQQASRWRMGFHLMPPKGWLNDPNGLCQKDGLYHVYHQYRPSWPAEKDCCWGHATSTDLCRWTHHGVAIDPSLPEEANGVWSGCAVVMEDCIHYFYTANRCETQSYEGEFDYIHTGRQATQVHTSSPDGFSFSGKQAIISQKDYPAHASCHVRDPKVWYQGDSWHMLLGARLEKDKGAVFLFQSKDLTTWDYERTLTTDDSFGYMWECPDRIELAGHEFLALCPQGLPSKDLRWQNHDQAGYFVLHSPLLASEQLDTTSFREWDMGFDFYAPQSFVDEQGRSIMYGWMGEPYPAYSSTPEGCDFWYCLTVPRQLSLDASGAIRQYPVPELEKLHQEKLLLDSRGQLHTDCPRADIGLEGIQGPGSIRIDSSLVLEWADGLFSLRFEDENLGAGRRQRNCPISRVKELRVLIDNSAVEIFLNRGEQALATRFFPTLRGIELEASCSYSSYSAWTMQDGMFGTY